MIRNTKEWVEMFDPAPGDDKSRRDRQRALNLLDASDAPFSRKQFDPGHVTASALIFSPDGKEILLARNAKLNKWLPPGGHVDKEDADVVAAARREATEETSVQLDEKTPPLLGIDVHGIPARKDEPEHSHYDLLFGFRALSRDVKTSDETPDVEWTPLDKAVSPERLGERFRVCIERGKAIFK